MLNSTPKGWIKLQRDLIRQEVFNDSDTLRVFLYLVCRAVTSPVVFNGISVERGEIAVTYRQLSMALNISKKRMYRIIGALKKAHYLEHKKAYGNTHGCMLITICKYDGYLPSVRNSKSSSGNTNGNTKGNTKGHTNDIPTLYIDREISTNVDIDREEENSTSSSDKEKELIEKLLDDNVWKVKITEIFKLDETSLVKRLDEFFISNECRGKYHKDLADMKSHFVNWLKIVLNPKTKISYNNENNETGRRDQRRGMDAGVHSAEDFAGPF